MNTMNYVTMYKEHVKKYCNKFNTTNKCVNVMSCESKIVCNLNKCDEF